MKKGTLILLFLLIVRLLSAQADGIYRIKLVTVNKDSDLRLFNNLKDLGVVSFEPYKGDMLRVYLGNYIGKFTADRLLPTVVNRGFVGAFVEKGPESFSSAEGDSLTHTMQFIALKKLDIRTILNNPKLKDADKKDVFIWYHNGFYRVSLGIMKENQQEKIDHYKNMAGDIGFGTAFTQKFAGVAPVAEKPKIEQPKQKLPASFPTEIKKIEKKDIFELENKKSGSSSSSGNTKLSVDPSIKPKEAKANPNATLKPAK